MQAAGALSRHVPAAVTTGVAVALLQRLRGKSMMAALSASSFVAMANATAQKKEATDSVPVAFAKDFVPGFVGALSAAMIEPSVASAQWTIWLFIRAVRFGAPEVHGVEYVTGSIAAGVNLSTYLWDYTELLPSYALFLSQCGGSNGYGLEAIRAIRLGPQTAVIRPFCHVIHPETSLCRVFWLRSLAQGVSFAARIHFPLHVLWHFTRSKKSVLSADALLSSAKSLFRAVAFLSVYPALAFAIICTWWKVAGGAGESRTTVMFLGMLVGVSLAVESPARRKEVAAFTFTHALIVLLGLGKTKPGSALSRLLFATAVGAVFTQAGAVPGLLRWAVRK